MPAETHGRIRRIVEAISDGTPIDWQIERDLRPELQPIFDQLQRIETLASLTRSAPNPPPRDNAPPVSTWGPLQVLEKLGEGSFGEVYRAWDPSLEREVALKLLPAGSALDASDAERYLNEARMLARVRQRNVLVVYGADRHEGRIGLWTDLVKGRTLESLLAEQGPYGAEEAALIGTQLCRALAAVHECGLVHRDVKASNVMRAHGGNIVLLDFGATSAPRGAFDDDTAGTPLAMAPELFRGANAGPGTDLYSLGVLLYRLVSGSYPVEAANLDELKSRHERGEAVPLRDRRSDLPAVFVRVVDRSLAANPAERFASAGAMERGLAHALGSMTPSEMIRIVRVNETKEPAPAPASAADPGRTPEPSPPLDHQRDSSPWSEQHRGALLVALLIAVSALVMVVVLLQRTGRH
jgi:serine/threonine protein kinase